MNDVVETFQEYLLTLFPGQDVYVKMRTHRYKLLSGFWCWDMSVFLHNHVSKPEMMRRYRGALYQIYYASIEHRTYRWSDVERRLGLDGGSFSRKR